MKKKINDNEVSYFFGERRKLITQGKKREDVVGKGGDCRG
jgi:hypothetical protein